MIYNLENYTVLGIPKGNLQKSCIRALELIGIQIRFCKREIWSRTNYSNLLVISLPVNEIPYYLYKNWIDCGLCGFDVMNEFTIRMNNISHSKELVVSSSSKCLLHPINWVLAVHKSSGITNVFDLASSYTSLRICTGIPLYSEIWLKQKGITPFIEKSYGATEGKTPYFYDAIIECTDTGESMKINNLVRIDHVLTSSIRFYKSSHEKNNTIDIITEIANNLKGLVINSMF